MHRIFPLLILTAVLVAGGSAAQPQDALSRIHAILLPLRHPAHPIFEDKLDMRSATPAMSEAKHLLRDWIERELARLPEEGGTQPIEDTINAKLAAADLFCPDKSPGSSCSTDDAEQFDGIGYLEPVSVRNVGGYPGDALVVETDFGILCGRDDSAYAYEWRGSGWRRLWSGEHEIAPGYTP